MRRVAAASALGTFAVLGLAACTNEVTSHAVVRPTRNTGEQALHLLRGEETDPALRYVYGYIPGRNATCGDVHKTPSTKGDRYGVLVCEASMPWSVAYFVNASGGTTRAPDDAEDHRLALIATAALVPMVKMSEP
jgi:hypothetical protein